jgi:uncharacterized protein
MQFLVLPGYADSGPRHWQTNWEKRDPRFKRVKQRDWNYPDRAEWVGALGRAIADHPGDMILVAHSLACLLVAHWTQSSQPRMRGRIRGAFLVAPIDPASPAFPAEATGFVPVPRHPLPFPSVVVASTNDPYASVAYAAGLAQAWGSRCEIAGPKGHLNAESDLGDWPEGWELLNALVGGSDASGGPAT